MFGSAVSLLGSALQAGAVNMPMLIVGRFIGGMAVGQLTSTIPLYAAELSEPKYRGLLSGLLQFLLSWGFLVAQWLGYGFNFTNGLIQCEIPYNIVIYFTRLTVSKGACLLRYNVCPQSSSLSESSGCANLLDGWSNATVSRRPTKF